MKEISMDSMFLMALDPLYYGPYEERKIAKTKVGKLDISTIWAADRDCYETAVLDAKGSYPVELYETREEAERGHARWVDKAPDLLEVDEIGPDNTVWRKRKL